MELLVRRHERRQFLVDHRVELLRAERHGEERAERCREEKSEKGAFHGGIG